MLSPFKNDNGNIKFLIMLFHAKFNHRNILKTIFEMLQIIRTIEKIYDILIALNYQPRQEDAIQISN